LLDVVSPPFVAAPAWAAVATVHDPAYVDAVRTGHPRALAESQGFSWSREFGESVARIWAGHIQACRTALGAGMVLHPVSGAHHASYASGSGFCTFNFLVGAVRAVGRQVGTRTAVIDLDAHPGDGTYRLAGHDPGVALFDIAGSSWVNVGDSEQIEYHVARNAKDYRDALDRLPAFLDRVRPALVQYQAGMDPFEDDPVGGIAGVTPAFRDVRDRFVIGQVRARGIPLVVNLAGGYVEGIAEQLHVATIRAMADL